LPALVIKKLFCSAKLLLLFVWTAELEKGLLILVACQLPGNLVIAQKKEKPIQPRAYYLEVHGNDKNDGSLNHPRKTLFWLNAQHIIPGDSILLKGGQRFSGTLVLGPGQGGNAARPVLVSSYGNGHATIQAGDSAGILIYRAQYINISNLHLVGAGRKTGNIKPGCLLDEATQVQVDNLDIAGFQKAGLLVHSSSHIRIVRVQAHDNGAAGIEVGGINGKKDGYDVYIAHCLAENNPGDPTNLTNHSGNGIVVGNCRKVLIEYCTATNNGWDMPRIGNGPVGIWAYEADSLTIQYCLSYMNKTSVGGADGGGFDLDGGVTHSLIQYCLAYGNQGAGFCIFQYYYASSWHDNIFRFNISENDGSVSDAGAGLYVWNSSGDENLFYNCQIYNNTIYNAKVAALSYSELSKRKNFSFYNNIFVGRDSLIKGARGEDIFQGNDWWSLTKAWTEKQREGLAGITIDPGFKRPGKSGLTDAESIGSFDQYNIPGDSPLRQSGLDLLHVYGIPSLVQDFNGKAANPKGIGACF
jgi:hypothetical protein